MGNYFLARRARLQGDAEFPMTSMLGNIGISHSTGSQVEPIAQFWSIASRIEPNA